MSKMKQYIDLMTPMEAYQKGYDKGQEDVCTVSVSDIYEKGELAGIKKVVDWIQGHEKSTCMDCLCAYDFREDEWQAKLKEWGIKNDN